MKQPPNEQELSLKLFVVLSKAYKTVMDLAEKDAKQFGLPASEFSILELLYQKGKFPLQQIGDRLLVTSGSITYNIDKLEKKGYLKREACPDDRRVTYAVISEKGKKLFDEIFPSHAQAIETILAGLDTNEKQTAIELLKKLGIHAANRN